MSSMVAMTSRRSPTWAARLAGLALCAGLLCVPAPAHAIGGGGWAAVAAAVKSASAAITGALVKVINKGRNDTEKQARHHALEMQRQNKLMLGLHEQRAEEDRQLEMAKTRGQMETEHEITAEDCLELERRLKNVLGNDVGSDAAHRVAAGVREATDRAQSSANPAAAQMVAGARHDALYCSDEDAKMKVCEQASDLQNADTQSLSLTEGARVGSAAGAVRHSRTYDRAEDRAADDYIMMATTATPPTAALAKDVVSAKGKEYRLALLEHNALLSGATESLHGIKSRRQPRPGTQDMAAKMAADIEQADPAMAATLKGEWSNGVSWMDEQAHEATKRVVYPHLRMELTGRTALSIARARWDIEARALALAWYQFKELESIRQLLALQLSRDLKGLTEEGLSDHFERL